MDPADASAGVRQTLVGVSLDGDGGPQVLDDAVVPLLYGFALVANEDSLFWLRQVSQDGHFVVMKRAKCGGAAVPITTPIFTGYPALVSAGKLLVVPSGSELLLISP